MAMGGTRLQQILVLQIAVVLGFASGILHVEAELGARSLKGSIAFATVSRSRYAFDIFSVQLPNSVFGKKFGEVVLEGLEEVKLTDEESVNYNGKLVEGKEKTAVFDWLKKKQEQGVNVDRSSNLLLFVSERNGTSRLYINFMSKPEPQGKFEGEREVIQQPRTYSTLEQTPQELSFVVDNRREASGHEIQDSKSEHPKGRTIIDLNSVLDLNQPYLYDRPSIAGGRLVFVSTVEAREVSRQSWAAVYSAGFDSGSAVRLTPQEVSDLSPALSPSGRWVVASSDEGRGWQGEVHGLNTDLYTYTSKDGSYRRLVVKNGGWPCWGDESTIYFHRQAEDGWWSIYRIKVSKDYLLWGNVQIQEERLTPPGVHAFTPAAPSTGQWLAVATRRAGSEFRHIEIFDLTSRSFIKITENLFPHSHHYNPFVSASGRVGYHRCRGHVESSQSKPANLYLERIQSPLPHISMVRLEGDYPSFSPDGSRIAYLSGDFTSVVVINLDGSGKRKLLDGQFFGTAWDPKRAGVIYLGVGRGFSKEQDSVHVKSLSNIDGEGEPTVKQLTKDGTGNNAFPSPSPDGKHIVFRSGRSGHKNLYIMNAVHGEEERIWRLTEGNWTDTMCNWSPDGNWIAFASDRQNPGSGSFAVYLIHPDGTGLHLVLHSAHSGRVNHPWFSPDSKSLVFTTDYAGVSAEPISLSHHFQPYGEIFIAKIDGSDLQRLTHNSYEDGTPSWGPAFLAASDVVNEGSKTDCGFTDCHWLNPDLGSSTQLLQQSKVFCSHASAFTTMLSAAI